MNFFYCVTLKENCLAKKRLYANISLANLTVNFMQELHDLHFVKKETLKKFCIFISIKVNVIDSLVGSYYPISKAQTF